MPPERLSAFGAPGEPCEGREQHKIDDREADGAEQVRNRSGDTQVALPQPACARPPHLSTVRLWRHARELRVRIVHVKHFVTQDLFEDGLRLRIVVDELTIDGET